MPAFVQCGKLFTFPRSDTWYSVSYPGMNCHISVTSFIVPNYDGMQAMEITLPSGVNATIRTQLRAKDKFAVQGVIRTSTSGEVQVTGLMSLMETALMARLIESWTDDAPLPSEHSCPDCMGDTVAWHEHVRDEFGEVLDLDDYNKLEEIITPMLEKVLKAPNLKTSSASAASS